MPAMMAPSMASMPRVAEMARVSTSPVVGILGRGAAGAGDDAVAAGDHGLYRGGGDHIIVQVDGNGLAQEFAGGVLKGLRAGGVQLEAHAVQRLFIVGVLHAGLLDVLALDHNVAVGIAELQVRRGADDAGDLLGIVDIGDLNQYAIGALYGHVRLGEAGVGQAGAQRGHRALQQALIVLHAGIRGDILRGYAAAQIQAQADGFAHGLEVSRLARDVQSVQRQERRDDDQHRDDHQFDQTLLHSVRPPCSWLWTQPFQHSSYKH